jgi:hypothetical protein
VRGILSDEDEKGWIYTEGNVMRGNQVTSVHEQG